MSDLISLWIEESKENEREFRRQELIVEVAEAITHQMKLKNVTRSKLSSLLEKTTSYVTQLLSGSRNMTLSTLSDLAFCLETKLKIELIDKNQQDGWACENGNIVLHAPSHDWSSEQACNDESHGVSSSVRLLQIIRAAA